MQLNALLRLAFATATHLTCLTMLHTVTRWFIKQKARRHTPEGALRPLVGIRFQVLFHSPLGVLFTFPSRYWFTIGRWRVFSLTRWSSQIHTRFLVSRATWEPDRRGFESFVYRSITFYGGAFQRALTRLKLCNSSSGSYSGISGPATPCVQRV